MKKFLTFAGLALALAAAIPAASAQQQQQAPRQEHERQDNEGHGRRHFGRRGGRGGRGAGPRALERLNLTDAQRTQLRSIHEATRQRTESQRAELRQLFETRRDGGQLTAEQQARVGQLRNELEAARESAHQQTLALLTAEQRAQLEQWQQERKSRRRDGMRRHRQSDDNEQQ